jgi:hypothetical protein
MARTIPDFEPLTTTFCGEEKGGKWLRMSELLAEKDLVTASQARSQLRYRPAMNERLKANKSTCDERVELTVFYRNELT